MIIIGYIIAVLIGVVLSLIGGGGSTLTVPLLVYLFGLDPVIATGYSFFIIAVSSSIGLYPKYKDKLIDFRVALLFGIPSIITILITRIFVLPIIPETIFNIGTFLFTKQILVMVLFSVLMIYSSVTMIRGSNSKMVDENLKSNYSLLILQGSIVGSLISLIGAGGGFLIIPALVQFANLPMKKAVGTSLFIIALNSVFGFGGDLVKMNYNIDWQFILLLSMMAVVGIFIGNMISKKIAGSSLKKGFGWFILIMGITILTGEILKNIK
ncbi:MAG: sulfite exporter TauE/SafE family protein [Bacteroidia bacterium]